MPRTFLISRLSTLIPSAPAGAVLPRRCPLQDKGRALCVPNFCILPSSPAWAGPRPWSAGLFLACLPASPGSTRVGRHDRLPLRPFRFEILIATGPPSCRPCRTPPVSSKPSSLLERHRARRGRSRPACRATRRPTSSVVFSPPLGTSTPSQIATIARPCDSPAVRPAELVTILGGRGDAELDAAAQPASSRPSMALATGFNRGCQSTSRPVYRPTCAAGRAISTL